MMFFTTRTAARNYAASIASKAVDMGASAPLKRRWAVKIVKG